MLQVGKEIRSTRTRDVEKNTNMSKNRYSRGKMKVEHYSTAQELYIGRIFELLETILPRIVMYEVM